MTTGDYLNLREKLENEITDLLQDFENQTGLDTEIKTVFPEKAFINDEPAKKVIVLASLPRRKLIWTKF